MAQQLQAARDPRHAYVRGGGCHTWRAAQLQILTTIEASILLIVNLGDHMNPLVSLRNASFHEFSAEVTTKTRFLDPHSDFSPMPYFRQGV